MTGPLYYPLPQQRRQGHRALLVGIGVGAAGLVACCGLSLIGLVLQDDQRAGGNDNDRRAADIGGADLAESPPAGIGQPVRDGQFEFVVTSIECGIARIGDGYLYKEAQGQFCLVRVTVRNIGDRPQMFTAGDQRAYNAAGQRYDTDSGAAFYLAEDSRAFLEEINPGNSVNATLVFDIPKDAAIARLELHDSFFSFGVDVAVT